MVLDRRSHGLDVLLRRVHSMPHPQQLCMGHVCPLKTHGTPVLQVMAVNLRGVFLCLKHQIPLMLETAGDGGAIVITSSTAGVGPSLYKRRGLQGVHSSYAALREPQFLRPRLWFAAAAAVH